MFSIVTGYELNPVHDPKSLFEACVIAGIPELEVMQGMVSRISDRKLCLMCETTKRIPKPRKTVVKATKADTPEARKARVDSYISWYTPERMFAEQSIFDN